MPEGEVFECPNCGAPLVATGAESQLKCSYCGSTVIVPPELRTQSSAAVLAGDLVPAIETNVVVSPQTSRWIKTGIWAFVILMVLTVVIPLVCSLCGVFAGLAGAVAGILGAFLPSFAH